MIGRSDGSGIGVRPELDRDARQAEWTAAPLGRLGRRLVAQVERYLEFFAIAGERVER